MEEPGHGHGRGGQDAHPARGLLAQRGAQQQVGGHGDSDGKQGAEELPGGQAEENAFLMLAYFFGNFDFDNGSPHIYFDLKNFLETYTLCRKSFNIA